MVWVIVFLLMIRYLLYLFIIINSDISNQGISDLTGIEDFSDLKHFYCDSNQLNNWI